MEYKDELTIRLQQSGIEPTEQLLSFIDLETIPLKAKLFSMNTDNAEFNVSDLLQIIYNRAKMAAIAKFGGQEPDQIHIQDDGVICVVYKAYNRDYDDTEEYLNTDDLTADLDILAKERAERLDKERKERLIKEAEQKEEYDRKEKEKRRVKYLELKKEFE